MVGSFSCFIRSKPLDFDIHRVHVLNLNLLGARKGSAPSIETILQCPDVSAVQKLTIKFLIPPHPSATDNGRNPHAAGRSWKDIVSGFDKAVCVSAPPARLCLPKSRASFS